MACPPVREHIVRKIVAHLREDRTGRRAGDLFAWTPGHKMTVVYTPWGAPVLTLAEMTEILRRVGRATLARVA